MFNLHTHLKYMDSVKLTEIVDDGLRMSRRRRKNGKNLFNGTGRTYSQD